MAGVVGDVDAVGAGLEKRQMAPTLMKTLKSGPKLVKCIFK